MADPKPRQPVLTVAMTAPQVIGALSLLSLLVALLTWWVVWWWITSGTLVLDRAGWQCSEATRARPTEPRTLSGPGWVLEWLTAEQAARCVTWRKASGS